MKACIVLPIIAAHLLLAGLLILLTGTAIAAPVAHADITDDFDGQIGQHQGKVVAQQALTGAQDEEPACLDNLERDYTRMQFITNTGKYMLFNDAQFTPTTHISGVIESAKSIGGWGYWDCAEELYEVIEKEYRVQVEGDNGSRFLVVLTTWDQGGFYRPMANEVAHIGLEHWPPPNMPHYLPPRTPITNPIFDHTDDSGVHGLINLGRWDNYYTGGNLLSKRLALLIGQELGHAWGVYPNYVQSGETMTDMVGIEGAHWSLYLDTGKSVMEGLDWHQIDGTDTFTANRKIRNIYPYEFSDLDLYLMGLLPPEKIDPWFVIRNPRDCVINGEPGKCPPPGSRAHRGPNHPKGWGYITETLPSTITATGTKVTIHITQVMEAEGGPRTPHATATVTEPQTIPVTFIVLKRPGEALSESKLAKITALVESTAVEWKRMTKELSVFHNRSGELAVAASGANPPEPDSEDRSADLKKIYLPLLKRH